RTHRRARPRRIARAATTVAAAAVEAVAATAARAGRAMGIAEPEGGLRAALLQGRRLAIEAAIVAGAIAVAAFVVFHFYVHTIRNPRPLGGANIDVTNGEGGGSEAAFAVDPTSPRVLFGAANDLRVYVSSDAGAHWRLQD